MTRQPEYSKKRRLGEIEDKKKNEAERIWTKE